MAYIIHLAHDSWAFSFQHSHKVDGLSDFQLRSSLCNLHIISLCIVLIVGLLTILDIGSMSHEARTFSLAPCVSAISL